MKRTLASLCLLALALTFAAGAFAQDRRTTVNIPPDVTELANGYAAAFLQLNASRAVLYFQTDLGISKITEMREIRAHDGVLIIRLRANGTIAISASRVLVLTDTDFAP